MGSSFHRFISAEDRSRLRPLLKRGGKPSAKIQVLLNACDDSQMPAQISIRSLAKDDAGRAAIALVVTDMTETRRNEQRLRALSQRLVQSQEAERGLVALELHDHITQLLCAILVRSQALADRLSSHDGPVKQEATRLREMLGEAAMHVERISHNLRPSILDELGLVAVLRDTTTEFAQRTGVSLKLACVPLATRLPVGTELALYRILQEALTNVEKHARARHVAVRLKQTGAFVQLVVNDDGIGFDLNGQLANGNGEGGLGLLSMRERAAHVGGNLKVKSARRTGTEIMVRIPLPPGATTTNRTNI